MNKWVVTFVPDDSYDVSVIGKFDTEEEAIKWMNSDVSHEVESFKAANVPCYGYHKDEYTVIIDTVGFWHVTQIIESDK